MVMVEAVGTLTAGGEIFLIYYVLDVFLLIIIVMIKNRFSVIYVAKSHSIDTF